MNALLKIATINALLTDIAEITMGNDCFDIELGSMITRLEEYKKKYLELVAEEATDYKENVVEADKPVSPREIEEEEDDFFVACKCKTSMDIRGRCDPVRSAKQFSRCPARFDTAYFHINNDFEKYKDIEASCNRGEKQEKFYKYCREEPFFLSGTDLEDEILYLVEQDEEQETENCCVCCDQFIPYADEDSGKWCDSEERWVCYSCKDDVFCAECDEYFPDEGDLEYLDATNEKTEKYCCDCSADKNCEDLEETINEWIERWERTPEKLEKLKKIQEIIGNW